MSIRGPRDRLDPLQPGRNEGRDLQLEPGGVVIGWIRMSQHAYGTRATGADWPVLKDSEPEVTRAVLGVAFTAGRPTACDGLGRSHGADLG